MPNVSDGRSDGRLILQENGAPVVVVGGGSWWHDRPRFEPEHQVTPVNLLVFPQAPDHLQQLALLDGFSTCPVCRGWTFCPCVCGSCHQCCTGTR